MVTDTDTLVVVARFSSSHRFRSRAVECVDGERSGRGCDGEHCGCAGGYSGGPAAAGARARHRPFAPRACVWAEAAFVRACSPRRRTRGAALPDRAAGAAPPPPPRTTVTSCPTTPPPPPPRRWAWLASARPSSGSRARRWRMSWRRCVRRRRCRWTSCAPCSVRARLLPMPLAHHVQALSASVSCIHASMCQCACAVRAAAGEGEVEADAPLPERRKRRRRRAPAPAPPPAAADDDDEREVLSLSLSLSVFLCLGTPAFCLSISSSMSHA